MPFAETLPISRDRHGVGVQHLPVDRALLAGTNAVRARLEANDLNGLRRTGGDDTVSTPC